jgi:tRNA(Ile)-lysidine synthase
MSKTSSASVAGAPLEQREFERLMRPFEPFERKPAIAVAVSGGRDSLALALLARDWAQARDGKVVALVVDHGLRAESADEAATTRDTLGRLGIAAEILRWRGAKPRSAIQEAARVARYRLIFEAAERASLLHVLVAHHADDQRETIVMRAARDSGADGLAGMAAMVEMRAVRLLRPLLPVARARLTATLEAAGVAWLDDPSNVDQRFERARLRRDGVAALSTSRDRSAHSAARRSAAEARLATASVGTLERDGVATLAIDRSAFNRLSSDLRQRLLARVVQAVGGGAYPPKRAQIDRALTRLAAPADAGKSGRASDFTLAACKLTLRQLPDGRRQRWLVRPEKDKNGGQPVVPAAFFGCGAAAAHHVD